MDIDITEPMEPEGTELTLKSGKTVLFKMKRSSKFYITVVEWILLIEKSLHSIRVEHSRFSGRKRIFLDNTCVKEQTDFLDVGMEFQEKLGDLLVEVDIYTNGLDFYYDLRLDGTLVGETA